MISIPASCLSGRAIPLANKENKAVLAADMLQLQRWHEQSILRLQTRLGRQVTAGRALLTRMKMTTDQACWTEREQARLGGVGNMTHSCTAVVPLFQTLNDEGACRH